ncbi:hypothetical protein Pyn_12952 [Prunus yedoensis var. nudiflora]|uniref:F-box protein n=1 Tax=Prunus yedoensis var. nudiflora TaxID=2094558 RepID=A0A314UVN7_PRUYE|nr:hypothetical protein Pyn_12952 [Prunus yedoensis var. nudiflora]
MSLQLPVISEAAVEQKLFVVGACNDLVLCCPTKVDHREYYICNPYTKKWVALPPPLNPLFRIHRVEGCAITSEFYVDIFFSETGEWRESANVVCGSRKYFDIVTAGVACNGKLYFAGTDCVTSSYVLELDPFQGISNISTDGDHIIVDKCRFSLAPLDMSSTADNPSMYLVLGACRGHLRVSEFVVLII